MSSPLARPEVLALRSSEIRKVANGGIGHSDLLPFWFGESDRITPQFIRQAAADAVLAGQTFYTHNLGRIDLRQALSLYLGRLHSRPIDIDRLAITNSGVSALMIASQAVLSPGDQVVVLAPTWPNLVEIPKILSAEVRAVPLEPIQGRWALDLDRLLDALTPATRALILNSPNNPTGWTLPADDRQIILDRCRAQGIWLITDDVYERLWFGQEPKAPSFLEIADLHDRVISTNSFSKSWRMTGWRLGWMVAPPSLTERLGVLLEYNTSCAPDFIQAAGVAALVQGEPSVAEIRAELAKARVQVLSGLRALPRVEAIIPEGGMYAFFGVRGETNSAALAGSLLETVGLGFAPGVAFGPEGEGWLRWCFAATPEKNAEGLVRLERFLEP